MGLVEQALQIRGVERVLGVEGVLVAHVAGCHSVRPSVPLVVQTETDGVTLGVNVPVCWRIPVGGNGSVGVVDGQGEVCWCPNGLRNSRCGRSSCGRGGRRSTNQLNICDDQFIVRSVESQPALIAAIPCPNQIIPGVQVRNNF